MRNPRLASVSRLLGITAFNVALVATVAILFAGTDAQACRSKTVFAHSPPKGATGVPLNAKISVLVQRGLEPEVRLKWTKTTVSGGVHRRIERPVAATATQRPGPGTHVNLELVPEQPLAPGTTYVIEGPWDFSTEFTTGEADDTTPPPRPTFTQQSIEPYVHEGSRSDGSACWVGLGFIHYAAQSEGATTFRIEREGGESGFGLPAGGRLAFSCPAKKRTVQAKLYAVDLAGNVSEPQPITLDEQCIPEDDGTGCTAASSGLPGVLLAAGVALRTLRRRRQ